MNKNDAAALSSENLEKVTGGSNALEQLERGLNINRDGTDAAGLSTSEKMRGQIKGLMDAATNEQDGIAMVDPSQERLINEQREALRRLKEEALRDQFIG